MNKTMARLKAAANGLKQPPSAVQVIISTTFIKPFYGFGQAKFAYGVSIICRFQPINTTAPAAS